MTITKKLLKNTTMKDECDILQDSKFFNKKDMVSTNVPMLNVALSGRLDGGLTPGLTMIAGPSKHFKTCFSLILAKAYLEKYKESAILFYDSEFGTPNSYFQKFNIDTKRIVHTPITDVEQLKHDIITQLNGIERGDKVLILLDSIGNLASRKELEDAKEGKSVADMTRAKGIKSLFRMVTPHLTTKDIPMIAVNHTYQSMEMFSKPVVGGGTGSYYSSDNIWIVGRQQIKEEKEINGYSFVINVEKSRYVKEKSKIPIVVTFEEGIDYNSGLFDAALEGGFITEASKGWYEANKNKVRRADLEKDKAFWDKLIKDPKFNSYIMKKYMLGYDEVPDAKK